MMILNGRRIDHLQRILLAIEDITDRHRSEARQKVVMGELQHRVKNILMNVRALARLTKDRSRTLDDYYRTFDGRVAALGRTQDLLVRSRNDMVPLDGILRLEIEASGGREGETFSVAGPPVELRAPAAQAIAMAIHELTTNAAKHGALRRPGAAIAVDWHNEFHDSQRHLRLRWRETGVHDMAPPDAKSFGMQVIERMVPYSLGGTSLVTFHPDGVECTIVFPLAEP
jgi:two-component sensor histidine kinase